MHRRAKWYLVAILLAASVPVRAIPDPPDESRSGSTVDTPRQEQDGAADQSSGDLRGDPPHDQAPSHVDGNPPGNGAGSAEPPAGPERTDGDHENPTEEQHRKWVESIWNSP